MLAMDQLRGLAARFPDAEIYVACQTLNAELYEACPYSVAVLPFDRRRFRKSAGYRREYLSRIRSLGVDVSVNSVFSRETLTDAIALASRAPIRVAWRGDNARTKASKLRFLECFYTHVLDGVHAQSQEIHRNGCLLDFLGCGLADYGARIWLSATDDSFADAMFRAHGLNPQDCIALFAGAQRPERTYYNYGEALRQAFPDKGVTVIALGSLADLELSGRNLDNWGGRSVNLCGETSIRGAAAILGRCRLGFGAETGAVHLATALGIPTVVLLGGGHFGRFMPYSHLQSAAVLPLDCFDCNWSCPFTRVHCVADVPPALLAKALRESWNGSSKEAKLFRPSIAPTSLSGDAPLFDPSKVEAPSDAHWVCLNHPCE
ncbi:MAG: glycosyltransferase family 9 protein [Holophagaceae bacterium]|nr:glycosyltransferase family 9 protein [Holophagaceae bacterium]